MTINQRNQCFYDANGNPVRYLMQYNRDAQGHRRAVVVAFKLDDNLYVGWSQCKKPDRFNLNRGLEIAISRAMKGSHVKPANYRSGQNFEETYNHLMQRASHYYK